jgi:chromosome segregation ATPase
MNKFDEIFQNTGNSAQAVNKLHEKVLTTIKKIRKVNNEYTKVDQEVQSIAKDIESQQGIVESNNKKRKMMETLSNSIIEKMIALYQKHEEDLASERAKRQQLAESFQSKMNTINDQLNTDKDRRTKEVQANDEIRKKITKAIDEYKEKEKAYNDCMDQNQAVIKDIEKKMQTRIQGDLQVTIKSCEGKKAKYEKVVDEVKHLSERIDDKLKEFGSLKDEMETLTKKFENLKVDI